MHLHLERPPATLQGRAEQPALGREYKGGTRASGHLGQSSVESHPAIHMPFMAWTERLVPPSCRSGLGALSWLCLSVSLSLCLSLHNLFSFSSSLRCAVLCCAPAAVCGSRCMHMISLSRDTPDQTTTESCILHC